MNDKQLEEILNDIRENVLNGKSNEDITNIIECIYKRDREKLTELIKEFAQKNGQNEDEKILIALAIACTYQKDKKYIMIAGILDDITTGQYKFDYTTILRLFFDSLDNYNIKLAEQFLEILKKASTGSLSKKSLDDVICKEVGYTFSELEQAIKEAKQKKEQLPEEWQIKLQTILIEFKSSEEPMIYLDEPLGKAEREILTATISRYFEGRLKRYNIGVGEPKRQVIRYMDANKVNKSLSRDYTGLYESGEYLECIEVIKNYLLDPKEACMHPAMYAYLALSHYMIGDTSTAKFYLEIAEALSENNKQIKRNEWEESEPLIEELRQLLKQIYQHQLSQQ